MSDIVVGLPMSTIDIESKRSKRHQSSVEWIFDKKITEQVEMNDLIKKQVLKCAFYNIRNDCGCCS